MKNHYLVLGVSPTSTHEEIKRAYYTLSRQIHPDKQTNNEATDPPAVEFHQLSVAWEVLGDATKRREYDRQLSTHQNRNRGVVQDEIDLDDMDFDPQECTYAYLCRCSGTYVISENDLAEGREIAPCTGCSLKIRVLFEDVDEE
ncbi:DnaJ sub C member 24 [Coemansia sp. RSA 1822]|nr:DnaJ sub C member 24 [Coemansia sp. RSA 638]KAJ2542056.1 DnaJ sub C member 24 [Coemansia sp. RSA 1853]KAJ2561881.1 DnaJ sub C member 24 [Coemansia sp. RSA 1822]